MFWSENQRSTIKVSRYDGRSDPTPSDPLSRIVVSSLWSLYPFHSVSSPLTFPYKCFVDWGLTGPKEDVGSSVV